MNTVNASTGFSGFQLHIGRSPRIIPPILTPIANPELQDAVESATALLQRLTNDAAQAHDNLLQAKVSQAHSADNSRRPDPHYQVGNLVMLSTMIRHHQYKTKGEHRTAKFFPQWDGPYKIIKTHPEASTYTLDIPTNAYPVYHASKLKKYLANDPLLFPGREFTQPGLIVTSDGLKEYLVDQITDVRH
jgi:hypothetical protein